MLTRNEQFIFVLMFAVSLCITGAGALAVSTVPPVEEVWVQPPAEVIRSRPQPHILIECVKATDNLNRNRTEYPGTQRFGKYVYQYGICREI